VENELSPSLISLSPLTTASPRILPHSRVQSSKSCHRIINLSMVRSLGFASNSYYYLIFIMPTCIHLSISLQHELSHWSIIQKVRKYHFFKMLLFLYMTIPSKYNEGLIKVMFTAFTFSIWGSISQLIQGSFHLSLAVLVRYRCSQTFLDWWWTTNFHTIFHVDSITYRLNKFNRFLEILLYRTFTFSGIKFIWFLEYL